MTKTADKRKSASDQARDRVAIREMMPPLILLVVIQGSLNVLNRRGELTPWYVVWSFAPLVPFLWLMWTQVRALRRADEYQRRVQLEALAIGFAAMVILSLVAGLLDGAGMGNPRQSLQVINVGGLLIWVAALGVLSRPR
jgi:hypothetical protein